MRKLIYILTLAGIVCVQVSAQSPPNSPEELQRYVPVLPSVKARFWKTDPSVGYAVQGVGGGVYVISDNGWQSAFLVTNEGVIVFDAPASFGKSIPSAIAKVTDKPITMLVYSHAHKDHIGGSAAFKNIKDLKIVALDTVTEFLKEMNDPNRLIPNVTFTREKTVSLGGQTVELTRHAYHSNEGDLFIYVPKARFLMAIDCVTDGYVPFQGFDITANFHEYMKVFDELLTYRFETFVGGHLTSTGNRADVKLNKEFTMDVYNTVKRIHNNMDFAAAIAEAVKTVGPDNEFLLFKVFLDKVTYESVKELRPRWIKRLAGVDVWLESHVRTALIYVRWDDN
ncbi:MAG: Zn-dependent hydrolase [Bryobacterales bacterium]|nr:Zn-dependent hydrolase [Bryobacterales bacterium]